MKILIAGIIATLFVISPALAGKKDNPGPFGSIKDPDSQVVFNLNRDAQLRTGGH